MPRVKKPKPRKRLNHFTTDDDDMGPLGQLRWMHRSRIVHRTDAERLQALRPAQHFADHARALVGGLKTVAAEARHVQENVGQIFVWNDKSITL